MKAISALENDLHNKLIQRKISHSFRQLTPQKAAIDFWSNDYLGFAKSAILKLPDTDLAHGATGARLISGNLSAAADTEKFIANFHGQKAALFYNSGYMANVGVCAALFQKNDTIFTDACIHASLIDGIQLSHAKKIKFKHNDIEDLHRKIRKTTGRKFIVVESIYSMDGDTAPLEKLIAIAEEQQAYLIVDEAHALGVVGNQGKGWVNELGIEQKVFATIYTYGKALGLHGAAVVGSQLLKDYLINFSRPFIFTTALPPHSYLQVLKAYQQLPFATEERKKLYQNIDYFKLKIQQTLTPYVFIQSHSPIQGILVGNTEKALHLANGLVEKGIAIKAIIAPTVSLGAERLRICLHSFNNFDEIDYLFELILKL